jgi:hypothetical protein
MRRGKDVGENNGIKRSGALAGEEGLGRKNNADGGGSDTRGGGALRPWFCEDGEPGQRPQPDLWSVVMVMTVTDDFHTDNDAAISKLQDTVRELEAPS